MQSSKSATARNSGALDQKPMRLVNTEGFDAVDDKGIEAGAQDRVGAL
jgi:hypothetical protein